MRTTILLLALALPAWAQHDHHSQPQETGDAAMAQRHVDMGPHMKVTALRPATPADLERANELVVRTRAAIERYQDVQVAERDGYRIFLPQVQQKMYHFTNYRYAIENAFRFNPEHPTSLLYEKRADGSFRLIGAMYTAPKTATPEELDVRVPLAVAQWHAHVNLCVPPRARRGEMLRKNPRFGLQGSITTRDECEREGGKFYPQLFGWMVHVYPWESDPKQVWSLERQMHKH